MSAPKWINFYPHQGFNRKIAVWITTHVGTMWCAYVFAGIGIGGLTGALTGNAALALTFGAISSYFLQLVLLPVIMVGQNVQQAHNDALAEQTERNTEILLAELKSNTELTAAVHALLNKEKDGSQEN